MEKTFKPQIKTSIPGPKSLELARILKDVESQNITFISDDFPVFLEKSKSLYVFDVDGNRYVDLTSFFGVSLIGHNHPVIRKILRTPKLLNGMGDVLPSRSKVEFLSEISSLLGGGYVGILGQNGADAVESAIKTAWLYTGKKYIITFEGSYHGLSIGTLPVTYNPKFKKPFEGIIPEYSISMPFPADEKSSSTVFEEIKKSVEKYDVAMILLEPIQARGGVRIFPKDFVKKLYDLAKEKEVVLVFDEIFTGFGRCGRLFAFEYFEVKPDIVILGKALSSSFPLSLMMGRKEIMSAWPISDGEAIHTSTFLGHPLICDVALNVVRQIVKNSLWERSEKMGSYFLSLLTRIKERFPYLIKDVRGRGLLIGIEFSEIPAFEVSKELLKKGYIALPSGIKGEVLELAPPVEITKGTMELFAKVLEETLNHGFAEKGN